MIDNCRFFFIELHPAFASEIPNCFADVGAGSNKNVPTAIDEARYGLDIDGSAKLWKKEKIKQIYVTWIL